jgi:RNA polymerase sigma-70 factor, ECF subfamily
LRGHPSKDRMKTELIYANDEAVLLEALRNRDAEAFTYLFNLYSDKIYRLSISLLKDDVAAEGVVQDTFLRLIERLDQFEGRANLGTWLYRIAYNLSVDRLRKRKPDVVLVDEPGDGRYPTPIHLIDWKQCPEQLLTDAELTAELDKAIAKLPEKFRIVFILREIEGLSTKETAKITGLSISTTKVRLHRGRLFLREHLTQSLFSIGSEKVSNEM